MDNKTSMNVVLKVDQYNFFTRTFDFDTYHPGERIILEFLLLATGRVNITFISVPERSYKQYTDLDFRFRILDAHTFYLLEKRNQTLTHPYWYTEHNMLTRFREPEYQISLTGVLQVFNPQVWVFINIFLMLFNFKLWNLLFTFTNRFVPGLRKVSFILANKCEAAKKFIFAIYFVGCFFLVENFKANLSTKLTVHIDRNINYLDDIFKYPDLRIILHERISSYDFIKDTRQDIFKEYERRLKKFPPKDKDDLDAIFNKGNAIFISSLTHLEYFCLHSYTLEKALHYGKDSFLLTFHSVSMSNNASIFIKNVINMRIMNYWETGHQILANTLLNNQWCSKYLVQKRNMEFSKTSFHDLSVMFIVFAALTMLSILALIGEFLYESKNSRYEWTLRKIELDTYSG